MNTRWKPSCLSSANSRWAGSNGWASTPALRSPSSTARPDISEISRSADLPPSRTATLPNARSVTVVCLRAIASGPFPDDADLTLEVHPAALPHRQLHFIDQSFDIRCAGSARIDDKVGVLGRHCGSANRKSLQAARLDEARRVVTGRI